MISRRKILTVLIIQIFSLIFFNNSMIAGDYSLEKVAAKNAIEHIETILRDASYSLIDISDKNLIHREEIYKKYFANVDPVAYEFYSQRIPEEYLVIFMYFTKDRKELRELVYAVMRHESINFKAFVHHNKNGSTDYGPMMLNSRNIESKDFMRKYSSNKEKLLKMGFDLKTQHGKYNYYTSICINFLAYLVKKYEKEGRSGAAWFALRAYNAGESSNTTRGSKARIKKGTIYANTVWNIYLKTQKDMQKFKIAYNK